MAITHSPCNIKAFTVTLNHVSSSSNVKGPRNKRLMMCSNINSPISVNLRISSSHMIKNKLVFEDRSLGIVCYKDENGEMICEGYDEGPRFHQQISRHGNYTSRDPEIIELLQRCWLQVPDQGLSSTIQTKGIEDFNGFNKLC